MLHRAQFYVRVICFIFAVWAAESISLVTATQNIPIQDAAFREQVIKGHVTTVPGEHCDIPLSSQPDHSKIQPCSSLNALTASGCSVSWLGAALIKWILVVDD